MGNWQQIPVKERMGLLKEYKKLGYSYRDAINDFETSLQKLQDGGFLENTFMMNAQEMPIDNRGMRGMMEGTMAREAHFGNPSAQRMISPNPKTGMTPEEQGTHYMGSYGKYAIPKLQDTGKDSLQYYPDKPPLKEAIKFNTEKEAEYFAKNYKDVAPMMRSLPKFGGGGALPTEKRKPFQLDAVTVVGQRGVPIKYVDDPNDPAIKAYQDSLDVYNTSVNKAVDYFKNHRQEYIKEHAYLVNSPALSKEEQENTRKYLEKLSKVTRQDDIDQYNEYKSRSEPIKKYIPNKYGKDRHEVEGKTSTYLHIPEYGVPSEYNKDIKPTRVANIHEGGAFMFYDRPKQRVEHNPEIVEQERIKRQEEASRIAWEKYNASKPKIEEGVGLEQIPNVPNLSYGRVDGQIKYIYNQTGERLDYDPTRTLHQQIPDGFQHKKFIPAFEQGGVMPKKHPMNRRR